METRRMTAAALTVLTCALLAGCGSNDEPSADHATTAARTTSTATDAAGRAQQVPARLRIDAGGANDLKPMVMAAKSAVERAFPDQHLTWESSFYGRSVWGICLGSSEAAAVRGREGAEWRTEQCEKTGIRILSLPLAEGVWLCVSSRGSMRPEVVAYVNATLDRARTTAAAAGVTPLSAAAIASSRSHYAAFVRDERARGTEPMVG